ncbi:MAG: DUF342 domain-containing protein [Campylobacterales bacterium]|nr:DUF342 domain-containing protein [Campylobacterales bacterium]
MSVISEPFHEYENSGVSYDFIPFAISTDNLLKELKTFSQKLKIPLNMLDYELIDYSTFKKEANDTAWKELKSEDVDEYFRRDRLLDRDFKIKQFYKVKIFPKEKKENFKLVMNIASDKDFTKVVGIIKKESILNYSNRLFKDLKNECDKKKIKAGVLLGFCDEELIHALEIIVSKVMINKRLIEDEKITLCEGIKPIFPVFEKYELLFNKKTKLKDNAKIDYSDRNFLKTIKAGDNVAIYYKPKEGRGGRDCRGVYIDISHIKDVNHKVYTFGKNIEATLENDCTVYKARKSGYIKIDRDLIDISEDEVKLNRIDFKHTGSILSDEDVDLKINVEQSSYLLDAVGSSVTVEAKEVKVKGNVAENSVISAKIVEIDGQTHQHSKIYAKHAVIHNHKGYIEADSVHIKNLERGVVVCSECVIDNCIGGEVFAKKIHVENLHSHASLNASDEIEIIKILGEDNSFSFDSLFDRDVKTIYEKLHHESSILKDELKKLDEQFFIQKNLFDKNQDLIFLIKDKIEEAKRVKQKPSKVLLDNLAEYKKLIQNIENYEKQKNKISKTLDELLSEIETIQSKIFQARLINHSKYSGYNEIKFKILEPLCQLQFIPKGFEKVIKVVSNGDEFEIIAENSDKEL